MKSLGNTLIVGILGILVLTVILVAYQNSTPHLKSTNVNLKSTEIATAERVITEMVTTVIVDTNAMSIPGKGVVNCRIIAGTSAAIIRELRIPSEGIYAMVNASGCHGWIPKSLIANRPKSTSSAPTSTHSPPPAIIRIQASSGGTWLNANSNMLGSDVCYVLDKDVVKLLEWNNSSFKVEVEGKCVGWTYKELLSCNPNCKLPER